MIHLVILGNLPRKSNSRRIFRNRQSGRPILVKSADALQYEKDFARQFPAKYRLGLNVPLSLTARIYYKSKLSDLSDELLCDMLQAVGAVENDRLFVEKHLYRFDDKYNPRVEIEIREAENVNTSRA